MSSFVDTVAAELVSASRDIHARPELAYEERYASQRLADLIEAHGCAVERGAFGIETAFVAHAGTRGPNVVVCCEYDALPGIGHACGHNVIGTAGVGAGLALAALADELDGHVTILGTPAEDTGGGGKKRLLDTGAFLDADVAMMVHPEPGDVEYVPYLANDQLLVEMHGKAAHASSTPWAGINALDAIVLGYTAVGALRQHINTDEKIHGIILDGGKADNIVPDYASARFRVRARNRDRLELLKPRVLACFEGAATQTGASLEHTWLGGYLDMRSNKTLAAAYRQNGERIGREFVDPKLIPASIAGSTDMGNVSYAVPSIHPVIKMVPLGVVGHTEEFARVVGERRRGRLRRRRRQSTRDDRHRRVAPTRPAAATSKPSSPEIERDGESDLDSGDEGMEDGAEGSRAGVCGDGRTDVVSDHFGDVREFANLRVQHLGRVRRRRRRRRRLSADRPRRQCAPPSRRRRRPWSEPGRSLPGRSPASRPRGHRRLGPPRSGRRGVPGRSRPR